MLEHRHAEGIGVVATCFNTSDASLHRNTSCGGRAGFGPNPTEKFGEISRCVNSRDLSAYMDVRVHRALEVTPSAGALMSWRVPRFRCCQRWLQWVTAA